MDVAGTAEIGGQLDMSGNKIVNLTDPTSAQDAVTKAYVDTQVSGTGGFGAWTSLSDGIVYQAATDGFVVVLAITMETAESRVAGFTDSSPTPTTKRVEFQLDANGRPDRNSFTMPVKKGDYWTVVKFSSGSTALTTATVNFLPLGN